MVVWVKFVHILSNVAQDELHTTSLLSEEAAKHVEQTEAHLLHKTNAQVLEEVPFTCHCHAAVDYIHRFFPLVVTYVAK